MENWRSLHYEDRPVFPETLTKQEAALAAFPQLEDYRRIRKDKAADPHRPIYHFIRPDGYLNDPNGLCFWEGRWHLFYQAGGDGCIHWGHAVSEDMLHWRDLPYAIYPGPEPFCFSGGTCVDKENHRVIAAYYGYSGYDFENGYKCGIMIATSSDSLLLNWTKVKGARPVITDRDAPCWTPPDAPPVEGQKPYKVFDAYIWKENGVYWLLTAGYEPDPVTGRRFREMYLHRCTDDNLENWEFVKPFLENDRFRELGDDGACPYFIPMGDDRRLLLHFSHRAVPKYLLGKYDADTQSFTPFSAERLTSGYQVVVAPSAYPTPDNGAAVIFNMSEQLPHDGWYGIMTLPQKLSLGGHWNDMLCRAPFGDISSLYADEKVLCDVALPAGEKVFPDFSGTSYEMRLRLTADNIPQTLEVEVLRSKDGEETTKISFYRFKGGMYAILPYQSDSVLSIDATRSSSDDRFTPLPPETVSVVMQNTDELDLRIFVDRSVVEVFVNDKHYTCMRAYPVREDSTGVSVLARGGEGRVAELSFRNMKSIYE